VTGRLAATALAHWELLDGYAVAHGMPDLMDLKIDRFCNYVYWMLTKGYSETDMASFRSRLWQPPIGEIADVRSPWSAENENAALSAFKDQVAR
jgi:hypothetical protein